MIENRFLYFLTYDSFQDLLLLGNIDAKSIVFIEDRSIIYTHGKEFSCDWSDECEGLLDLINEIVSDKTTVGLTVSPSVVFADNQNKTVTFTATSSLNTTVITFDGGLPVTGSSKQFEVTVSSATPTTISKSATFTVAGINKGTKTATVYFVYPISYGSMATYSASQLTLLSTATNTSARTYQITIPTGGGYIYFKVPKTNVKLISRVMLAGEFPSPVDGSVDNQLSDENYNVWKSNSQYDAGTYSFEVTAA